MTQPSNKDEAKPPPGEFCIEKRFFYKRFFNNASIKDVDDWHWQLSNRIHTLEALSKFITLSPAEKEAFTQYKAKLFPCSITPHYMRLIDPDDPQQAVRRAVIPSSNEFLFDPYEQKDPLHEEHDSPVPGIVHRYPDRVLFLVTMSCSVYCRYCTRSRIVGSQNQCITSQKNWEQAILYIKNTPQIRDVLISGGDPLTMEDQQIEWLLSSLRKIPTVEIIRIGTKAPVTIPQRINSALCKMLKKYHPLFINIHFAHPNEITAETAAACCKLADAGIPLGSQTVLLSGINDSVPVMKKLMQRLLTIRVKPYYIYQCDPILGSKHFRVPVSKGLEIMRGLRGHTSGLAVPTYVIDAPGGGGKIPIAPEVIVKQEGNEIILRNYEDKQFRYPDSSIKEE